MPQQGTASGEDAIFEPGAPVVLGAAASQGTGGSASSADASFPSAHVVQPEPKRPRVSRGANCFVHSHVAEHVSSVLASPLHAGGALFPILFQGAKPHDLDRAENLAWDLAGHRELNASDLVRLFDTLPKEPSPRAAEGSSFTAGALVHGGVVGVRTTTGKYPASIALFVAWLKHAAPGCVFSSIAVLDQSPSSMLQNAHFPNIITPLTAFQGGCLWVEGEGSEVREFQGHDVIGGPVPWNGPSMLLSASENAHCVLPWRCVSWRG